MIYLLDKRFRCNRITEQKHFHPITIPKEKTVLTFERCCNKGDDLWNYTDEELYRMVMEEVPHLRKFFTKEEVEDYFVVRLDDAYPVFLLDCDTNLKRTLNYISGIDNLMAAGRNGLFLNNNMHDCMVSGIKTAQRMIKQADLMAVEQKV